MREYETRRIQREAYKMNVTEAIRAHNQNEFGKAQEHYAAAVRSEGQDHEEARMVLVFLSTQTDESRQRSLEESVRMADKLGYRPALDTILPLIEDQSVNNAFKEFISAARENRKANTRAYKREPSTTPSGRYRTL